MNVALFGAGRIGKIHAANLARQPGMSLKYVVDISPDATAELSRRYGAQTAVSETVLGDSSVKAVVIASSTDTHADLIMRSAAAGKAIFCEKPVDLDLDRARKCADSVSKAGVTCMIGFNRRFDPTFAALKKRLDSGEIGEPEMLIITSRDPGAPPVSYIKGSGGIFKDMLIHDFDMFRFILGEDAETVYATGSCLTDPAIARGRGHRLQRRLDSNPRRQTLPNKHQPARGLWIRSAFRSPWKQGNASGRKYATYRGSLLYEQGGVHRCP